MAPGRKRCALLVLHALPCLKFGPPRAVLIVYAGTRGLRLNLRRCHVCLHAVCLHKHQADILMYGGEGGGGLRPEFVAKDKWLLAADFQSDQNITVRTRHIRLLPRGLCAAAAVLSSIWASPCMHAHAEALMNLMPHHLQADYFRAGVQLRCTNKHKEVPVPTSAHRFPAYKASYSWDPDCSHSLAALMAAI